MSEHNAHEALSGGDRLSRALVELADTLVTTFDIDDYLHTLCRHAHDLLDVQAVGVLLEGPDGDLQLSAASTDDAAAIDLFERQAREGPCFDAYRSRQQLVDVDLATVEDRWPRFVPLALEHGLQAVYAFPLRLRDDCIGAMNLFRHEPGHFSPRDVEAGQALADVATIAILSQRRHDESEVYSEQLQWALDSRVIIEQAKGMIAARETIAPDAAFELLRRHARSQQRRIRNVAAEIVDGTMAPPQWPHRRGPTVTSNLDDEGGAWH